MSDSGRWLSVGACCHAAGGWQLPPLIPATVPVPDPVLAPSGPGRARLGLSQLVGHRAAGEARLCPWGWHPQGRAGHSWVGSPGTLCTLCVWCFFLGPVVYMAGRRYEIKQWIRAFFVIGVSSASLFC